MRPQDFVELLEDLATQETSGVVLKGDLELQVGEIDRLAARNLLNALSNLEGPNSQIVATALINNALRRAAFLASQGVGGLELLYDDNLQALLTAWWWMTLFFSLK
jgi:hypothetical protein